MSRRKRPARGGRPAPAARGSAPRSSAAGPPATRVGRRLLADVAILAAVVTLVTVVAELAGAANLGVSLGIATIAFTLVLMSLMLKR